VNNMNHDATTPSRLSTLVRAGVLGVLPALLCVTAACAAKNEPARAAPADASTIQSLIGDAACMSDAQCKTIAIGTKACGGPQSYMAWSTARTDGAALQRAADAYVAQRREEIAARGEVSTCEVRADPGAYCAPNSGATPSGVCRLRPGGAGGAAVR